MLGEVYQGVNFSYSNSLSLITLVWLLLVSYGFCYFIVKKLPKGILRLNFLLPIFYILFVTPWYFPSSIFLRGLSSFFISWISSFKLLLFSFEKGDLILCKNYLHFVVVAVFPYKIRHKSFQSKSNINHVSATIYDKVQMYATLSSIFNLLLNNVLLLLGLAISISTLSRDLMIFVFALFMTAQFVESMIPQLERTPIFKEPYRATSLQNFWGRRWNRVSSDILRYTIYDPTRKQLEDYAGVGRAKVVALVITLAVSGIMHEIMFYHMSCGMKPTWEVTHFFILQGVCMALELAIKRFWVRTLGWSPLHPVVSVSVTLGFVVATTYWMMVLPVWRVAGKGCDKKALGIQVMDRQLRKFI